MIDSAMIVLGVVLSAIAQLMIKQSSMYGLSEFRFSLYFGLAGLCYVCSFGLYAYILKHFELSKISPIMTIGTMILVVLLSIMIFRETITSKQSIGLVLGILSVYLMIG